MKLLRKSGGSHFFDSLRRREKSRRLFFQPPMRKSRISMPVSFWALYSSV